MYFIHVILADNEMLLRVSWRKAQFMSEEILPSVSKAFLEMWIYYSSFVSWLFHLTLALRMIFTKLTSSF